MSRTRPSILRELTATEIAKCGPAPWDVPVPSAPSAPSITQVQKLGATGWGSQGPMQSQTQIPGALVRPGPGGGIGGIEPPGTEFVLRVRREVNAADAANSRLYGTMDIGFRPTLRPVMDEAPIASRGTATAPLNAAPDYFQQGGSALSKTTSTDAPIIPGMAPTISGNPFFGRMDTTQDPRNVIREARSGIAEDNFDADVYLNNRTMARENVTRSIPEGQTEPGIDYSLQAFEALRAQNSTYIKGVPK
jgi:hypothetical protein